MADASVRTLLYRYGLQAKKSLGQNFLVDTHYLDEIVAAADLNQDEVVLEVGPGLGTLTRRLAATAKQVVAVELDNRLIEILQQELIQFANIKIIHGDILKSTPADLLRHLSLNDSGADFGTESSTTPAYKVVANLPYYITSAVLRHLLETDSVAGGRPQRAVFMLQAEVAERICARPGKMSILAASVQFYAQPKIVARVPAKAFFPRPKVDSAVLQLEVYPSPIFPDIVPNEFFHVVRAGFSQKRKQLGNSLSAGLQLPKEQCRIMLEGAGVVPTRRPETVSLSEWRRIVLATQMLKPAFANL